MTSVQIRTLSAPPDLRTAHEKLVTSLNTRFQSLGDLDQLATLVVEAQRRNIDLQSRFSLSRSRVATLLADTRTSAESHILTAQEFSLLRHSLTDDLNELSQELVSTQSEVESNSTLLEDIETLHRNLRELQSVKGYVHIVEHILRLSECSAEQIRSSKLTISSASLKEYQSLQVFVKKVTEACSKVKDDSNDQTLNLVLFMKNSLETTWANIRDILSGHLNASAEKIGWPNAVDYPSASTGDRAEFEHAFRNLSTFQNWGDKNRIDQETHTSAVGNGLYSLQALIRPIALRFKYHFDSARQTNRLDKPEWYFTHILNVVHEHRTFMETVIQRLLDSSDYRNINAWREFTRLLFPILSRKLKQTVPALLPHPSLLAHTIYQALVFDAALLDEGFLIQDTFPPKQLGFEEKWEGASGMILGNAEWFEAWLQGEQRFAEEQYHEIISASNAWLVAGAEEQDVPGDLKATHSARRICSLIEQVTDRYSSLPRSIQRISFLTSVQLPLLNSYHDRITASLDAFETLSSALVRAVPGALSVGLGKEDGRVHVDNRGLTSGVEGVQRLCKALLSAKYVEMMMRGWAEELFFLELWTEINHKYELRKIAMTNPLLPDPKVEGGEIPEDTLFDEVLTRYDCLINRAEGMIVQQICGEIESLLKAHFLTSSSSPKLDTHSDQVDEVSLSQTLLAPIALLLSHLTFLRMNMSKATLTNLYRRVTSRLADHILHRQILYRGRFDLKEGKNIRAECELWVGTCRTALGGTLPGGRARIDAPWTKLLQAASLISFEGDSWTAINSVVFSTQTDEEWDAAMMQAVGPLEMGREEVLQTLRRREDCNH